MNDGMRFVLIAPAHIVKFCFRNNLYPISLWLFALWYSGEKTTTRNRKQTTGKATRRKFLVCCLCLCVCAFCCFPLFQIFWYEFESVVILCHILICFDKFSWFQNSEVTSFILLRRETSLRLHFNHGTIWELETFHAVGARAQNWLFYLAHSFGRKTHNIKSPLLLYELNTSHISIYLLSSIIY